MKTKMTPMTEAMITKMETRSPLAGLVGIAVEGDKDATARLITKLGPLLRCQMSADGAGGVAKTGLPQRSQVQQAFDQDHGRKCAN
jgi:hypothetical protein